MSKLGFSLWCEDGVGQPSCFVAPKSNYTKEEFEKECINESDGYYELSDIREGHARWFPIAPEGIDIDGGCYGLCKKSKGSFEVWICDVKEIEVGESNE